ncbi:hypothetical protein [Cryobacterium psychrophilum]|uniref:hypothetical protein n=1 Tax=Cryobacterium psychrophilum TaxID=41988 RepID=UPI0010E25664|nr:hypothetical protein [Cryobacterium psychrophilum]TDW29897.1 hypothetical protein EDD25_1617 [Cryobacterium psychrophilum]
MRELIASLRERRRLTINVSIEAELTPASEVTTEPPIWDTSQEQLAEANRRIKQLSTYLADTGWDIEGWAQ